MITLTISSSSSTIIHSRKSLHSQDHYFNVQRDGYVIEGELKEYEDSRIKSSLKKSHKRAHSSFRVSSSVCTTDIISPKKLLKDEVIYELNVLVFKLETIIQVLARERNEEYGVLHFNEEFSNELRLCLEDEERMLLKQEKNIIEEQRFRVEEAKRMRLEEDKLPHPEPNNTLYGKLIRIEFPKFSGDDMKDWVYRCKQFFKVDGVLDGRKIQLASMHMFGAALVWYQQYMKKAQKPQADWIRGLKPKVGTLMRMFQANTLSESYQLARMQEGHKCSGQLHSMEVIAEGDLDNYIDGDDETYDDCVGDMVRFTNSPQITLNALSGLNSYQTMRVRGRVAKKLGCRLDNTTPMQVSVANGQRMMSTFVCYDFKWSFQNEVFTSDVMLLPLGGCEMVLGIQWLATLGDMQCNFKKLIMKFNHKGRQLVLRGMNNTHVHWMQGIEGMLKQVELSSMALCVYLVQPWPKKITQLTLTR
ncbi:retrovirus-related pol polyprotein from transposon 17.6 [Tanacetum coccineum]